MTPTTAPPTDVAPARSPVLQSFRVNPFRVFGLPTDAPPDQAVWKSEELLTLHRAGLPTDPPELPWLPPADEPEIRQAVQGMEEPLRRLVEQACWFDFDADPNGAALRAALAGPDPAAIEEATFPATAADAGTPARLNRANAKLLAAALATADAWPVPDSSLSGGRKPPEGDSLRGLTPPAQGKSLPVRDPHLHCGRDDRAAGRLKLAADLWAEALDAWGWLLLLPALDEQVKAWIARLGDDSVGEDDAETVVRALTARLTDLVAGEVKAQLLAGRLDRVGMLVGAATAATRIDQLAWVQAFRPLRPLFAAEVTDLQPMLGDVPPKLDDVEVYVARLIAVRKRWHALDPKGLLGLDEFVDQAVGRVNRVVSDHVEYDALPRLAALLAAAGEAAGSGSVKQRLAGSATRVEGMSRWRCHFCQQREMDVNTAAMVSGKIETHREYGFNSTTIHYLVKRNIIPRCPRCADLHEYVMSGGRWAWGVLLPAALGFAYLNAPWFMGFEFAIIPFLLVAAVYVGAGFVVRWSLAGLVTPEGERPYWDVATAEHYQEFKREGCSITIDYAKTAFSTAVASSRG